MRIPMFFVAIFLLATAITPVVRAETIEFSEDELATESVLPVFDKTVVVRDRNVQTAGRFEAHIGAGLNLAEPLYSQLAYDAILTYHFDEIQGMNILLLGLDTSLSTAGQELKEGQGLQSGTSFNPAICPTVQDMFFANYDFTAYYGKMSITKQFTMNLSLYGFAGLGMVKWTDVSKFGFDVGMGQKFWFDKHSALRFDLFLTIYTGPDPTQPNAGPTAMYNGNPQLSSSNFASTTYVRPFLTAGYVFLF